MKRSESGFVSVIGIGVVVPFVFILLIVGAELNQFLGVRDGVQQIIDEEARVSLSRQFSAAQVSDRLRGRLAETRPDVAISSVQHSQLSPNASHIVAVGEYRGMIGKLGEAFLGTQIPGIPFAVVSRARRADMSVVLVVDRTIPPGADPCGDAGLKSRTALAVRLISSLKKVGVSRIDLAITPGMNESVERIEDTPSASLMCGVGEPKISRLAGIASLTLDSLDVAYRISELVFSRSEVHAMEQRAVVMITGATPDEGERTSTTFALLAMEAKRGSLSVKRVGIAVGSETEGDPFPVKSGEGSGSARYLVISHEGALTGSVPGVVAHHLNGRTFIAE